ncbi:MAG: hypothetical protein J5965_04645 [Aeriscardovia sp.]|nr:hypothetical protein [Aeriscardovia sp.]
MYVYLYYHCDAWKSFDSMRLQGVYATGVSGRDKLAAQIKNDCLNGDIDLDNQDKMMDLIKNQNIDMANRLMEYGFIACEEVEG